MTRRPAKKLLARSYVATYLEGGEAVWNAHREDLCVPPCPIHSRSSHHMRGWPQHWRDDTLTMERICPHGIGHPDPDDLHGNPIHGCDGCCYPNTPGVLMTLFDL